MKQHKRMVGEAPGAGPGDEWTVLTEKMARFGASLRDHYREDGNTEALTELRVALTDLTSAAGRAATAASAALRDPDVKHHAHAALTAFLNALSTTAGNVRGDFSSTWEGEQ